MHPESLSQSTQAERAPFVGIPKWVLRSGISPAARLVFLRIAEHADKHGQVPALFTPGIRRIAKDCGLGSDTVQDAIAELERIKALRVIRGFEDGGRARNLYQCNWNPPAAEPKSVPKVVDFPAAEPPPNDRGGVPAQKQGVYLHRYTFKKPIQEHYFSHSSKNNGAAPAEAAAPRRDPEREAELVITGLRASNPDLADRLERLRAARTHGHHSLTLSSPSVGGPRVTPKRQARQKTLKKKFGNLGEFLSDTKKKE